MKLFRLNHAGIIALTICSATIFYSCQKENSSNSLTDDEVSNYSDESTQAEASFDDAEDLSMIAANEESISVTGRFHLPTFDDLRLRIGPCATITVTPNDSTYPKTVRIDFGAGCQCTDGKFRKGAIEINLTGPIRHSGSVATITFDSFYLNHAHIEGTKVISNLSANGNIKFTTQVTGGKVTLPNGRGYQYEGIKYVIQFEGGSTNTPWDDIFRIEGNSHTKFNNGVTINLSTESSLVKRTACPWISKGTLKIKINDRILGLNYGAPNNGDCDNKALLTWGTHSRLITLP